MMGGKNSFGWRFLVGWIVIGFWAQAIGQVANPVMDPASGDYVRAQHVALTCTTGGALIHYTTSGADPTQDDPAVESGETVFVPGSLTLKARAFKPGETASAVVSGTYFITGKVAAGGNSSFGLRADGRLWSWGYNGYGGLGDGSATNRDVPVPTTGQAVHDLIDIDAGGLQGYGLRSDGTVWAWGYGASGRLGNGGTANSSFPVQVLTGVGTPLTGVIQTVGGASHGLALKSDGTVWAWGYNSTYGCLGINSTTSQSNYAVQVKREDAGGPVNLTGIISIGSGTYHSGAVDSNGKLYMWGRNSNYEIGDGTTTHRLVAKEITALSGENVVEVVGGESFTLARTSDGEVWGWGRNIYGAVGNNASTTADVQTPSQVVNGSGVPIAGMVQLAAGVYHSAALKSDGTVWTWGYNNYGQLGINSTTLSKFAVQANVVNDAVSLASGDYQVLAGRSNGQMKAWGYNFYGQIGDDSSTNRLAPVDVLDLRLDQIDNRDGDDALSWQEIAAGAPANPNDYFNGTLPTLTILSGAGQVGAAADVLAESVTVRVHNGATNLNNAPLELRISSGGGEVALHSNGPFGQQAEARTDLSGQAKVWVKLPGSGATTLTIAARSGSQTVSATVTGTVQTSMVATPAFSPDGRTRTSATTVTLTTATAGATIHYTLDGSEPTQADRAASSGTTVTLVGVQTLKARAYKQGMTPSAIKTANYRVQGAVAAGQNHNLVVRTDGTVWAWGQNTNGQIGDGTTTTPRKTPLQVGSITTAVDVAAGQSFSMALLTDGTVKAWGENNYGQLGDGSTTQRTSPVAVSGLSNGVAITAGRDHGLALKSDGTVWAWGYNGSGQLGQGNTTNSQVPIQVPGLTGIVDLAATELTSAALSSDGTIWVWGANAYGQLGQNYVNGTMLSPVKVLELDGVIDIAAGLNHFQALRWDGTVRGWGRNTNGSLGINNTTSQYMPVQTLNLTDAVSFGGNLGADGQHGLAIRSDGTLAAWGYNNYGQVGDNNSPTNRLTPFSITGLGSVIAAATGQQHTIALLADGTVRTWGYNGYGQLGNNTTTNSSTPISVPNFYVNTWDDRDNDGTASHLETEANRNDFFNGVTPTIVKVSGDEQDTDPETFFANPLIVEVRNGATPIANAPVTAVILEGDAGLSTTATGTPTAQFVNLTTNGSGQVTVYVYGGPNGGDIHVQFGAGNGTPSVFTLSTGAVLVGHWMLEDGAGTQAADSSGEGHPATLVNGSVWQTTGGYDALGAVQFDGTNDHLEMAGIPAITPGVTLALWARSDTATWNATGVLASRRDAFILSPVQGTKQIEFSVHVGGSWRTASFDLATLAEFDVTKWHHYAGAYDSETGLVEIYVDGVQRAAFTVSGGGTINGDTGSLYIGHDDGQAGRYFDGRIDDIRLFNGAVKAENLLALTLADRDGDDLPDFWEVNFFGNLSRDGTLDLDGDSASDAAEYASGTDPTDYFNGDIPTLTIVSGNPQTGDMNEYLDNPLVVEVRSSTGQVLDNAPVAFTIVSGTGDLDEDTSGPPPPTPTLEVRTEPDGRAQVYFYTPNSGSVTTVRVTAGEGTPVDFTLTTFDPDVDDDGLPDEWEWELINADPNDGVVGLGDVTPDGDLDGDGVLNKFDARPLDPNIGALTVTITNPVNGAIIP
jgi:alpha-tubulin suppressor-like RCC1 family protein